MKLSHFNFNLPAELLAEFPAENRDESRLMVINRKTKTWNYEFITNYFKTSDTTNKTPTTQYDIKKIDLKSERVKLLLSSLNSGDF